jgi:hypothetical protein
MVADNQRLLHSFFIINAGDAYMSKEKIVYILNFKILLHHHLAFLSFKEQRTLLPMTVLQALYLCKNTFEVNL